jgi:YVTN family beta-propeller protein
MPSAPFGFALHPEGKRVFVSAPGAGKVHVLDTGSNAIVAELDACQGASRMALTPDGSKLYVTCGPANEVAVIDTATSRRLARVPVGVTPSHIAVRDANTQSEDAERFEPRAKPRQP